MDGIPNPPTQHGKEVVQVDDITLCFGQWIGLSQAQVGGAWEAFEHPGFEHAEFPEPGSLEL